MRIERAAAVLSSPLTSPLHAVLNNPRATIAPAARYCPPKCLVTIDPPVSAPLERLKSGKFRSRRAAAAGPAPAVVARAPASRHRLERPWRPAALEEARRAPALPAHHEPPVRDW